VDFNVYADKPATSETLKGNTIIGDRIESYSLIPKKAGKLELPAIKVPWWNLKTQQVEYATLPARTFDVMPAASTLVTSAAVQSQPVTQTQAPLPAPVTQPTAKPATSNESTYGVIGLLLLALMLAAVWVIRLQAKIKRLRQPDDNGKTAHTPVLTSSKSSFATKDLSSIQSVEELARFLRLYASEHYGIRENASLDEALLALAPLAGQRRELADGIIKIMSAALYAGKQADLETLKHACRELLVAHKQPKNDNTTPTEKLPKLNPG
jgi:HAMP domain-containing protein